MPSDREGERDPPEVQASDAERRADESRGSSSSASPSPNATPANSGERDRSRLTKASPSVRATTPTPSDYHPLSPATGGGRIGLARRVTSVTSVSDKNLGLDVQQRRHAASVSIPGAASASAPASAITSSSSTTSPAVAALQAVAATHASGVLLTPRRVDADLLGLGVGPSRRRRQSADDRAASSLFGDDEETPRRPRNRASRGSRGSGNTGTPLSGGWAGYLDSLSRDEIEVLDTPFDVMSDTELRDALRPWEPQVRSGRSVSGTASPSLGDGDKKGASDRASPAKGRSTPATPELPSAQSMSVPLFPPSPPGAEATRAEHPLRVLSRAVRELREVISRLEDENARLRVAATPRRVSAGSGLNVVLSGGTTTTPSAEASPRPLPLPSVAERPRDQLHDSLADALSTSLTSPTYTHLALMEPRLELYHDDDQGSPTLSIAPKSPVPSTMSMRSERERARATSSASSSNVFGDRESGKGDRGDKGDKGDKKGWGIFGWAKKPSRKGSIASLAPSITGSGAVPALDTVDDDNHEWRRGDGGSAPSFRAIFLATRILTPDPASILIEPARANAKLAGLAHALVSNAQDEGITVRDPPGRARARSRAASISSAKQVQPPDVSLSEPTPAGPGYGDQALAATVGLGRTLLSLSRGKGGEEKATRQSLPPLRPPRSVYSNPQSSPHTPVTPNQAVDTPPPSVELGTIVPDESRPPTVLLSRQNLGSFFQSTRSKLATATRFESDEPPLTDRYGFIYDIQHANMLKDASRAGTPAPISLTGHIPELRQPDEPVPPRPPSTHSAEERSESVVDKSAATTGPTASPASTSSVSVPLSARNTPEPPSPPNGNGTHRRRPTALAPTPAKPIAAKDELTVSVRGSSSLGASSSTAPAPSSSNKASRLTVSSLLDQLTDIHDKQQKARTAEWDAFLRRRTKRKGSSERRGGVQDVGVSGAIAAVVALAGTQAKAGQEEYRLFQRLVRRGIPIPYRADVWAECSGARDLLVPGEYAEILAVHRDDHSAVMAEIEKDVGRTFPGNVFFGGDGPGVAKLRRLLVAYSWHNPAVGYCQGMNMLAATLLLTHTDEEQAFWVLHCIIERLLPADYYSPSLVGSRADQFALADLVAQHVPRVAQHLSALSVDLTSVTFGWFLSLFTDCLPVETLFRVWDVFFVEGHAVLFRVAIAILKLNELELCATESATDLFGFFSGMTSRLWGADKLIALQHSYKSAVRDADVRALVERHAAELQRELDGDSE